MVFQNPTLEHRCFALGPPKLDHQNWLEDCRFHTGNSKACYEHYPVSQVLWQRHGHFVVPPPVVDVSDADSTIIVHDSDSDVAVHDSKSDMGTIIVSDSEDGDLPDLQYPPSSPLVMPPITLDLCVDVAVCFWSHELGPRPFLTKVWFRPAPTEPHSIRLGDVVMADFKAYLESKGLPAGAQIERFLDLNSTFLDITHCWVPCTWSEKIAIFGRDKILYFRTCGTNVTLPAHFVDLL
ncbi:hypothetical protein C8J57DRAFT_1238525 [Mycena rebaudengoi]|nr:hypothetical protein C8J57DRAFT_1238525 [Mycena rebaudengoi]